MDYKEKYHNLYQFFGGYLNQSWMHIYVWKNEEPSYQPIVRKYKTENSKEGIEKTISQLRDVINLNVDFDDEDGEGADILTWNLGLAYYPPGGDGITYREWLKDVLRILEETPEETRKHFIPERI